MNKYSKETKEEKQERLRKPHTLKKNGTAHDAWVERKENAPKLKQVFIDGNWVKM